METIYTRCAGLDVHKKSVMVCCAVTDPAGQVSESVRTFEQYVNAASSRRT